MQTLMFHPAWEKTLAPIDKVQIEQLFCDAYLSDHPIQFTPLWEAINHKSELLVTVIIHNLTKSELLFHQQKLYYFKKETILAEHLFSLPSLSQEMSMPWTFIFPSESFNKDFTFKNGEIRLG